MDLDGVRARKWNSERAVYFRQLSCNAPKALIIPNIFAGACYFDSTAGIVGHFMNL